jgi:ABC-2 type transport system ATP-binding protein
MIQLNQLTLNANLGRLRLNIPNLTLEPKGILAVVGHNGAGKSSLLNVIAGLVSPYTGEVLFQGKNTFQHFEEIKQSIHLISWSLPLFQNMTGNHHINLLKSISKIWNVDIENELIKEFKLNLDRKIEFLSRGEQAKLKILLSLPREPTVVLLDEVTNELDTDSRRSILKKLDLYSFERNTFVIVATNMVDDIERYATTVLVLRSGEVVLNGSLDAIKEEKKSSFEDIVRSFERVV